MLRSKRWMLALVAGPLLVSVCPAQTASPAPSKPQHKSHKAAKPVELPPLPQGPLPQLPMDLIPATPPKVSYQNGLLTIAAQNSTLGDILRDVQRLTGASIEVPPNATERVVTRLGPGAPRDVLATLLNGSSFNYVMLGSNTNPSGVASIVLTTKSGGGSPQTAVNTPQPIYNTPQVPPQPFIARQQVVPQPAPTTGDGDDANAEEQEAADENADQEQTDGQADANAAAEQDQSQAQPANAGPKTPEQILDMLRRQQPMPPGQPGGPPSPPPQN